MTTPDNERTMPSDDPLDASVLLALAVKVAARGATLAEAHRREFITTVHTKSTDTDVVTAADVAVETAIIEALRAERPADRVLSEEAGASQPQGQEIGRVRWILDPIDGTVNYLYGIPYYAVSLAAEVDGVVVAGVVHNIATGDVWTAILGGGAYHDDRRLTGSGATDLSRSMVATGFGYDARRRADQGRVVAALLGQVRDIRRFGACALDLCAVASGTVDAYYERGLNLWDRAAGQLIATEAGLVVSGLRGAPAEDRFLLVAAPGIHARLEGVLAELEADDGP